MNPFEPIINKYATQFQVPAIWVAAVIERESSGRPSVTAKEKNGETAYGLMQILPSTARGLGYAGEPAGLLDPDTNIYLGTKLIADLYRRYGPDVRRIYSAYNSGRPDLYKTSSEVGRNVAAFISILERRMREAVSAPHFSTLLGPGLAAILLAVILYQWGAR